MSTPIPTSTPVPGSAPLLSLRGFTVWYPGGNQNRAALERLNLDLLPGRRLGLVGASGSGKSTLALAIPGLLPPGSTATGSLKLAGEEVVTAPATEMRRLRRDLLGLIFQDPVGALDPVRTIESQMDEVLALQGEPKGSRRARAMDLLSEVGLAEAARVMTSFPHQISGGMAQRVGIALALTGSPDLLIADEPTTSLDVITQRHILDLLAELSESRGMALLLVSHDLPVVGSICDEVAVISEGRLVESGATKEIFQRPQHPATKAMVAGVMTFRPGPT